MAGRHERTTGRLPRSPSESNLGMDRSLTHNGREGRCTTTSPYVTVRPGNENDKARAHPQRGIARAFNCRAQRRIRQGYPRRLSADYPDELMAAHALHARPTCCFTPVGCPSSACRWQSRRTRWSSATRWVLPPAQRCRPCPRSSPCSSASAETDCPQPFGR